MKKVFLKNILFLIFILLPISNSYADQVVDQNNLKTYIIRVASDDSNQQQVGLSGAFLQFFKGQQNSIFTEVNRVTPWEMTIKADYLRLILTTDQKNPKIKLEIFEKRNDGEHFVMSGIGHTFDSHTESSGTNNVVVVN